MPSSPCVTITCARDPPSSGQPSVERKSMSSENASQSTFFFNIRFCLMSLLKVKHDFIWRVLLRYNTRHHGNTFVGTMYFTVMGRRPVVIINYVKYSATYDIAAVALLWRWMSYITKKYRFRILQLKSILEIPCRLCH